MSPLILAAIAAGVGGVGLLSWYFSAYQQTLRAIRSAPQVRVADAPEGQLVRIRGTLRPHGAILVAPLSKRECAHYDVHVEVRVHTGRSSHWRTLFRERETRDFRVEDESGVAIVETTSFDAAVVVDHHQTSGTFQDATPELDEFLASRGHASTGLLGFNKGMRYREGVLEPGETVVVVGHARWEDDPTPGAVESAPGSYRTSGRKKRLRIVALADRVRASDDPRAIVG